jgi:hypothetical protein
MVASDPTTAHGPQLQGAIMRRLVTWGPVALTVAACAILMGAEPIAPKPFPRSPVQPPLDQTVPPYLARITSSGDTKMAGVFEECIDLEAARKSAQARARARPVDAPSPLVGCTNGHEMRPGGSIHSEMSCDRAKGAKRSFRAVSDGTPGDLRTHVEFYDVDAATGAAKTTTWDTHMVRLGSCPAGLKPGQMRRPGGPIIARAETARLLEDARGLTP